MLQTVTRAIAIAPWFGLPIILLTSYPVFARPYNFSVINLTGNSLTELYISPSSSTEWGENQLPSETPPVQPGEEVPISIEGSNPEACLYDIKGVFGNPDNNLDEYEVNLCQLASEQNPYYIFYDEQGSQQETLEIVNNTDVQLTAIYGVASDDSTEPNTRNWGDNLLLQPVDSKDSTRLLSDVANCGNSDSGTSDSGTNNHPRYDIRADFAGNNSPVYLSGVDGCSSEGNIGIIFTHENPGSEITATRMQTHPLTVTNNTGRVLYELYVSASDRADWGFNLLDTSSLNELSSGENAQFNVFFDPNASEQCIYDLEAVFNNEEGTEEPITIDRFEVDICAQSIIFENTPTINVQPINAQPSP